MDWAYEFLWMNARAVNRLRMERLSAFPTNQEQEEDIKREVATKETTKPDELRSGANVASTATMKRPLSAAAAVSATRSNQATPTNMVRRAIGLKRPISAFSGLRPKFHRPDGSKMDLSQKIRGNMGHKGTIKQLEIYMLAVAERQYFQLHRADIGAPFLRAIPSSLFRVRSACSLFASKSSL